MSQRRWLRRRYRYRYVQALRAKMLCRKKGRKAEAAASHASTAEWLAQIEPYQLRF